MNLNSKKGLIARLRRGKAARQQFTESHINKGTAHQLRATREAFGWSQEKLAQETGMNQNAISRLESPDYGRATITTLKRLAAALDVGLIVRFVPFSELVDWVSGTPRTIQGLNAEALAVPNFDKEEAAGAFGGLGHFPIVGNGAADSALVQDESALGRPRMPMGMEPLSAPLNAAVSAHMIRPQPSTRTGALRALELQ